MNEKRILDYIQRCIDDPFMQGMVKERRAAGVTAKEIESEFQIYRSNASSILNQLVKKHALVKIESRPVYFLPAELVKKYLPQGEPQPSYTQEEFLAALCPPPGGSASQEDPFDLLIGSKGSLSHQVDQAKAAVLYPPAGLHTLLMGESGIGKTLFARTMYNFGLKASKKDKKKYPYVEFNCADYAHNPQLLMTHLFGYVKGAFTGADEETPGLVERADGGILFLDEVHRLPPEGQELLFYLIDTGHYRKLGEADHVRRAKVLIIAATTEDPGDVLLKTFMRRIPLTITLPPFREKPLEERLKLVEHIFVRESTATQKNYILSPRVVRALASYGFPGNIGQLSSEIKVLCAHSFLNNEGQQDNLTIRFDHLSAPVREDYLQSPQEQHPFPRHYSSDILITPSRSVLFSQTKLFDEKISKNLLESIQDYTAKGYTKKEMNDALAGEIKEYYSNVLQSFYTQNIHKEEMYKVVDRGIVDFTIAAMGDASSSLGLEISQKNILVMAFHIKYMLERLEEAKVITRQEITHIETEYTREVAAAEKIVARMERHFRKSIPKEEKYFIAILLANTDADAQSGRPGLFIIAHGESTASSMANVCNRLMDCSFVQAIDAPLEQSVQDTYQALLREVKKTGRDKGAILLVDMGSLTKFGTRITKETGIPTHTIPNVTTLMALDLTRIMLGREEHIDRIYSDYINKQQTPQRPVGKCAVITVCASGAGTSEALRAMLDEELESRDLGCIKLFALSYADIRDSSPRYQNIQREYNILACVGNIDYQMQLPFFHVSKLISQKDKESFVKFIQGTSLVQSAAGHGEVDSLRKECRRFLSKNVTFLNPEVAVEHAIRYLAALDLEKVNADESLQLSLILHLGFMLERNICGNKVVYENEKPYLQEHEELHRLLRAHMHILEDIFNVPINDSEICFIIQTITGSK